MKSPALLMICVIPFALAACSEMPAGFGYDHASPMLIASGQFAQGSGGPADAVPTANSSHDKRPQHYAAPVDRTPTSIASLPTPPAEPAPFRPTLLSPRTTRSTPPAALPTPW